MGMFTQIFSKSHNPYELKGRWYKLSVEYDGINYKLISSDIPIKDPVTSGTLHIDGPTILLNPVDSLQRLFNLDIIDIVCNLKAARNGENISTEYVYHEINVTDVGDMSVKMDCFNFPGSDNERTPCSFDIYLYAIPHNNHYELPTG